MSVKSSQSNSKNKPVTMRDVARSAGVSLTTVSDVLNQNPSSQVADETRRKVIEAARAMGYQGSLLRRSIKSPLRHLGIAVGRTDRFDRTYTDAIFEGIREAAFTRNYYPILQPMPTETGQADNSEAIGQMTLLHRNRLIDGFVIDKQAFTTAAVEELYRRNVPLVVVNGSPLAQAADGSAVPAVVIDHLHGLHEAVAHLHELGHRRIAALIPPYFSRYSVNYRPYRVMQQLDGYRQALQRFEVAFDPDLVVEGDGLDRQATYQAVDRLLALPQPPTAIIAFEDSLAMMAQRRLEQRAPRIPAACSLVSYGGWDVLVRLADPALTVVKMPLNKTGDTAARMLIDLIEGRPLEQPLIHLKPRLQAHESTGPVASTPA